MPVSDTLALPSGPADGDWQETILNPWVDTVSDAIAALESGGGGPWKLATDYGTLSGTAAQNHTTIQTALNDHANWQWLLINKNSSISINDYLDWPIMHGKVVQGMSRNTVLTQTTANTPIFRLNSDVGGDYFHSNRIRQLGFSWSTQGTGSPGTDPDSMSQAIQFYHATGGGGGGFFNNVFEDLFVEKCTDAFKIEIGDGSGTLPVWGTVFRDIYMTKIGRHAVHLVSPTTIGQPSNTFIHLQVQAGPDYGGPTPTGQVIRLDAVQAQFYNTEIEGWSDNAIEISGGFPVSFYGGHVEHQAFTGASPDWAILSNAPVRFVGWDFSVHSTPTYPANGWTTPSGELHIFRLGPGVEFTLEDFVYNIQVPGGASAQIIWDSGVSPATTKVWYKGVKALLDEIPVVGPSEFGTNSAPFVRTAVAVAVAARVSRAAAQSIATGASWVAVSWDTAAVDTGTFWASSPNPTRITVPTDGTYRVDAHAGFVAGTPELAARILKNGATELAASAVYSTTQFAGSGPDISDMVTLAAGDYIELQVRHSDAGSVNTSTPTLTIERIGD